MLDFRGKFVSNSLHHYFISNNERSFFLQWLGQNVWGYKIRTNAFLIKNVVANFFKGVVLQQIWNNNVNVLCLLKT